MVLVFRIKLSIDPDPPRLGCLPELAYPVIPKLTFRKIPLKPATHPRRDLLMTQHGTDH